jgi:hypothetical protein
MHEWEEEQHALEWWQAWLEWGEDPEEWKRTSETSSRTTRTSMWLGATTMRKDGAGGDHTPVTGVLWPSVSFLEIYDRRGTMMTSPLWIRLRIVFRQKPKKSLENIFITPKYSLVKLGANRDSNQINTMYGIRCVDTMMYEDLRQLRRDIFSKTGGGPGFPDILEVQYLPPNVSTLWNGFIKLSIVFMMPTITNARLGYDDPNTDYTSAVGSINAWVIQRICDDGYYIVQLNSNVNTHGHCTITVVCYPLPEQGVMQRRSADNADGAAG